MAFIGLAIIFENPWWWAVTIVVLVREWSVTLLRLFVLKKVVIAADSLGKLKTTFQVIGLSGLVLPLLDPDLPDWMETPAEVLFYLALAFLAVAVVLTVVSGAQFFTGGLDASGTSPSRGTRGWSVLVISGQVLLRSRLRLDGGRMVTESSPTVRPRA